MFAENPWKSFLRGLFVAVLLMVIVGLNTLEFLHYFIARGENTLFDQPVEAVARAEFFIMLLFSLPALAAGLFLLTRIKEASFQSYLICGILIVFTLIKLFFYIPNVLLGSMPLWYILKQFPPILFSGWLGISASMRLSDLKYRKYL
ncbi:hypothetical protein J0B03_09460 [Alkalibacter rhizosphaerae]|uniref:Uncharacterized protein n=1 Tax=Alkalibacter rhizosphaerae TaxID=2815577 RepID=A0A974XFZ5_9FIRM|nr:hypothetical protein [Alkalibacter rhizosphaerae]QSX08025.1 hypothetical protein J0B03_09460 [Alkalibacter rhizosphaerae]